MHLILHLIENATIITVTTIKENILIIISSISIIPIITIIVVVIIVDVSSNAEGILCLIFKFLSFFLKIISCKVSFFKVLWIWPSCIPN